jgi:uncharacterized protein (TIGR02588 family)
MKESDVSNSTKQSQTRSPAEWTTFSIALLIVAVIVGLVIYKWVTQKNHPPILTISMSDEIREEPGQFYIPFSIANTGGETAESVQVIAELQVNGEIEESGEQNMDFLASGETEKGAFVFTQDPRKGKLVVRVASYKLP